MQPSSASASQIPALDGHLPASVGVHFISESSITLVGRLVTSEHDLVTVSLRLPADAPPTSLDFFLEVPDHGFPPSLHHSTHQSRDQQGKERILVGASPSVTPSKKAGTSSPAATRSRSRSRSHSYSIAPAVPVSPSPSSSTAPVTLPPTPLPVASPSESSTPAVSASWTPSPSLPAFVASPPLQQSSTSHSFPVGNALAIALSSAGAIALAAAGLMYYRIKHNESIGSKRWRLGGIWKQRSLKMPNLYDDASAHTGSQTTARRGQRGNQTSRRSTSKRKPSSRFPSPGRASSTLAFSFTQWPIHQSPPSGPYHPMPGSVDMQGYRCPTLVQLPYSSPASPFHRHEVTPACTYPHARSRLGWLDLADARGRTVQSVPHHSSHPVVASSYHSGGVLALGPLLPVQSTVSTPTRRFSDSVPSRRPRAFSDGITSTPTCYYTEATPIVHSAPITLGSTAFGVHQQPVDEIIEEYYV